ncbi:MAG: alkaline phosphatase family protein [Elusimicrobiota bacterium]
MKNKILKQLIIFFLFVFLLNFSGCKRATDDLYVFVITVEGMRADRFRAVETPTMDRLANDGAISYSSRVSVPSQARVNFVTIPTGAHAHRHGIVGASYYDEDMKLIETDRPNPIIAQENVLVPTIFEVLEEHDIKTGYITTKGFELVGGRGASVTYGGKNDIPDYIWKYKNKLKINGSQQEAVDRKLLLNELILERMKKAVEEDGVKFLISNFGALDYIAHRHGVKSEYYDMAIHRVDKQIGDFIQFLKRKKIYAKSVLIITSSHGFTHIKNPENVLMGTESTPDIPQLAEQKIPHKALSRGGRAFSLYLDDSNQAQKAFDILKNIEWIKSIYSEHELDGLDGTLSRLDYYFPGRTGDFFIDIKPNYTLNFPFKGQHGSTSARDMTVPLIFSGVKIGEDIIIRSSENVDIAPTVLALYGLNYKDHLKSDGGVIEEIFE